MLQYFLTTFIFFIFKGLFEGNKILFHFEIGIWQYLDYNQFINDSK